jgi:hypothetical protein
VLLFLTNFTKSEIIDKKDAVQIREVNLRHKVKVQENENKIQPKASSLIY